jgi:hypothetical protein
MGSPLASDTATQANMLTRRLLPWCVLRRSGDWCCPTCHAPNRDQLLPEGSSDAANTAPSAADAEAIAQMNIGAVPEKPEVRETAAV